MKRLILYLLIFVCIANNNLFAKCIKDLSKAGISFESLSYKGEKADGNFAELNSSSVVAPEIRWIVYCSNLKIETQTFISTKFIKFANEEVSALGKIEESKVLLNYGFKFNKDIKLFGVSMGLPLDLYIKEDLTFQVDDKNSLIYEEEQTNLIARIGANLNVWRSKLSSVLFSTRFGPAVPLSGEQDSGFSFYMGVEYFRKFNQKMSFTVDLDFNYQSQDYKELEMIIRDISLKTNIIFRF